MNLSVRVLLLLLLLCSFLQKKLQALQTSVTPSLNNEDDEGGDILESKKKAFVVARVYPSEYLHLQRNKDEPDDSLLMEKNDGPAAILDILNRIDNDNDSGDSRSKDQNQIHLQTTLVTRSTKDKTDTTSSTLNTATTMTNTSTAQKEDKLIPTTPSKITERRNSPGDNGKNNNASNERKIKCNCNEKGIISYQNCHSMVIQLSCVESQRFLIL